MKYTEIVRHLADHARGEWFNPRQEQRPLRTEALSEKGAALSKLEERCRTCTLCPLSKTATNLVFSDGSPDAKLIFIGEAPGADEDAQGKPFVGRAGKLLTATIEEQGLSRKEVYICNILKHRPPDNRNPLPQEIEACTPYLLEQLSILKPKVIITLGNFSTRFILSTEEGITRLRGKIMQSPLGYSVIPTLHPAAILRNMNNLPEFQNDIRLGITAIRQGV